MFWLDVGLISDRCMTGIGCGILNRIKRRKSVINCTVSPYIKDKIDEMVAYGMFSTISDAVAISLME